MDKKKIKNEAYRQSIKIKLKQLNDVRNTFDFSDSLTYSAIFLFSSNFEAMYNDEKMLYILNNAYLEFQTKESREQLLEELKSWADKKGYSHDDVFN